MFNEIKNKQKELQKHIPGNTTGVSFEEYLKRRKKRKKHYLYIRILVCAAVVFAVGNYAVKPIVQGKIRDGVQKEDSNVQEVNAEIQLKENGADPSEILPNPEDQIGDSANEIWNSESPSTEHGKNISQAETTQMQETVQTQETENEQENVETQATTQAQETEKEQENVETQETIQAQASVKTQDMKPAQETTSQQAKAEETIGKAEEMMVRTMPVNSLYTMAVDENGTVFYCGGSYSGSFTISDSEGTTYDMQDSVTRLVRSPVTGSIYAVSISGSELQLFLYDGQGFVQLWDQPAKLESDQISISLDDTMPVSFLSTGEMILWNNRREKDMEIWILDLDTGNSDHLFLETGDISQSKRYYSVTVLNDNFYLWTDLYGDSVDVFDHEGNYIETYTDSSIVGSSDRAYYSDGTKIWIFGNDLKTFQNGKTSYITDQETIKAFFIEETGKNGILLYPYISEDENLLVFYNANEKEIVWIENPSFLN